MDLKNNKNLTELYNISLNNGYVEKELEDYILINNDCALAMKCAKNVKFANKNLFARIIIAQNDPELCYEFLMNIKGVYVTQLLFAIFSSKNVQCIYKTVKDMDYKNYKMFQDVVIKNATDEQIYDFAVLFCKDIKSPFTTKVLEMKNIENCINLLNEFGFSTEKIDYVANIVKEGGSKDYINKFKDKISTFYNSDYYLNRYKDLFYIPNNDKNIKKDSVIKKTFEK